jgi:hypothetical protein
MQNETAISIMEKGKTAPQLPGDKMVMMLIFILDRKHTLIQQIKKKL